MMPGNGSRGRLALGALTMAATCATGATGVHAADLRIIIASQEQLAGTAAKSLIVRLHPSRQPIEAGAPEGTTWRGKFKMEGRLFQMFRIEAKLSVEGKPVFGRALTYEIPMFHALRPQGVRFVFPLVSVHTSQSFIRKHFANYHRLEAFDLLDNRALLLLYQSYRATAMAVRKRLATSGETPDYFDIRAVYLHVHSGATLLNRNYFVEGRERVEGFIALGAQFVSDTDLLDSATWLGTLLDANPEKLDAALKTDSGQGRLLVRRALEQMRLGHRRSLIAKFTSMWREIARLPCEKRLPLLYLFQETAEVQPPKIVPVRFATIAESIAQCARLVAENVRKKERVTPEEAKRTNQTIDRAVDHLDRSRFRLNRRKRREFDDLRRYLHQFKFSEK